MNDQTRVLLPKYFDEFGFVDSSTESFDYFIDEELQRIVEENKVIEPTIIPPDVESFKIHLDKIWIEKPTIIEADGSKRNIYPVEARLRKLTYSAPMFLEVSAHIDGVQRESFRTQIGNMPIMLKSKFCHLKGLSREELIKTGEDPTDPGGYFIINGTEKILIAVEDLVSNKLLVEQSSTPGSEFVGKLFSEMGSYKIPHLIEKLSDNVFYLSFTRVKRVPIIIVLKALGMTKDKDIMQYISPDSPSEEAYINLVEFADIKTEEEALDFIAKKIGMIHPKDVKAEKVTQIIDKYLFPHIGTNPEDRLYKAQNLCKYLNKYIKCSKGELPLDDIDHYSNKRLKLAGDLLADLLRVNIKILIRDVLYNFQRIVKRGKFPSIKVIIREKLLTSRIYSAMATGTWTGGRKGIAQRIERSNFLQTLSHLQRVVSPLSSTQECFEARELHSTHFGRLCPSETPEGGNIGLRKNLALLCSVSSETDERQVVEQLKNCGLKLLK